MKCALLQRSLDQTISRQDMEEASVVAPSVARADCAVLQRELFGIVVKGLEQREAEAFQAALTARGFPTEVIDEEALPALAMPVRRQGLRINAETIAVTDFYGREEAFSMDEFVFAAGAHLKRLAERPEKTLEWVMKPGPRGSEYQGLEPVTNYKLKNVPEFRIEIFVAREPYRFQCVLEEGIVLRLNDRPYSLRDRAALTDFLKSLKTFLPAERVNRGIRDAGLGVDVIYPSVRAFEEEIVWRFFQLTRSTG